jgi:hypothetical protein
MYSATDVLELLSLVGTSEPEKQNFRWMEKWILSISFDKLRHFHMLMFGSYLRLPGIIEAVRFESVSGGEYRLPVMSVCHFTLTCSIYTSEEMLFDKFEKACETEVGFQRC